MELWQVKNGLLQTQSCSSQSLESVVERYRFLRREGIVQSGSFRQMLRGSRLQAQISASRTTSDTLKKRRDFLMTKGEHMVYSSFTGVLSKSSGDDLVIPKLSVGLNMILAGATCFIVGFVGSAGVTKHLHFRIAAGLVCLIIILFVEMVLFVIRECK
jgi:hypothetical protein